MWSLTTISVPPIVIRPSASVLLASCCLVPNAIASVLLAFSNRPLTRNHARHFFDTACQLCLVCWRLDGCVELRVVSILMILYTKMFEDSGNGGHVTGENQRSQHAALRDAFTTPPRNRPRSFNGDVALSVGQVRTNP